MMRILRGIAATALTWDMATNAALGAGLAAAALSIARRAPSLMRAEDSRQLSRTTTPDPAVVLRGD